MRQVIIENSLIKKLTPEHEDILEELFIRSRYILAGIKISVYGMETEDIEEILEIMNQKIPS